MDFAGTERFQILSCLGEGAMGVVYEALDRERGTRVALKTLRSAAAGAIHRFKTEFRALQDLQHPNLVHLGELIEQNGTWLFTMELVDGVHFLDWVAPDGIVDHARLRAGMQQLALGLAALHAGGKVHRDIKPSNLLVTPEGRVVLLDFGLVVDAARADSSEENVVGTTAYMAPEQAASKPVGRAADWYSVGAILYEALTARLPFQGGPLEIMQQKQHESPPRPREVATGVPDDLDALAAALLAIDPDARPDGAEVLRRLGQVVGPGGVAAPAPLSSFVGRRKELDALHVAFAETKQGKSITVCVHGESGVGKSALVREFARRVGGHAIVLAGRCYERESAHYKAIDGVVDAIGRHLIKLPPDEATALLPLRTGLLVQVFPSLRRVEAVAQAPLLQQYARDPRELRTQVFAAFRELLARLAERRPLVVAIDDLHWADADSLAMLAETTRGPDAPPLLLIATMRTLGDARRALGGAVRELHLDVLPPDAASDLAATIIRAGVRAGGGAGAGVDPAVIAKEAGGLPLFIEELARHVLATGVAPGTRERLEDALRARIESQPAETRHVLELIAVASAPTAQDVIKQAAALDADAFGRAIAALRAAHLVLTGGARGQDTVEAFHDRVRDAVLAYLDPAARLAAHHRLALAHEASPHPDDEALAIHWGGAGDRARAALSAARAAAVAADAFAFDRAARLYRTSLEQRAADDPERSELYTRLGDALSNAGKGAESGRAYLAAAEGVSPSATLELSRRAADQLLRSGFLDEGLAAIRTVLASVGMTLHDSPRRALASLAYQRARVRLRGLRWRERPESQIRGDTLQAIDACWSVAVGLGVVDTIRGADFQARGLSLALAAGEPYRVARALCAEGAFAASAGGASRARTAHVLSLGTALAERMDHPHAIGVARVMGGIAAFLEGRWADARALCEQGETVLRERCVGAWWERNSAQMFAVWAMYHLGEYGELRRRVARLTADARDRGDQYAVTSLGIGMSTLPHLAADDPERLRRESTEAMRGWTHRGFDMQHAFDVWAHAHIDLYVGDGEAAHRRVITSWPLMESTLLLRVQLVRVLLVHLRGRCAIARAVASKDPRRLLAEAAADAKRLEREHVPWATALARTLRAGLAGAAGDARTEAKIWAVAEDEFMRAGMTMNARAARHRRGVLVGGDDGAALVAAAESWMRAEQIKQPAKIARMHNGVG